MAEVIREEPVENAIAGSAFKLHRRAGCGPFSPYDPVQAPIGCTGMLFTRNWVLETITRSPAFNPEVTE